jgi:hypothetical protein
MLVLSPKFELENPKFENGSTILQARSFALPFFASWRSLRLCVKPTFSQLEVKNSKRPDLTQSRKE